MRISNTSRVNLDGYKKIRVRVVEDTIAVFIGDASASLMMTLNEAEYLTEVLARALEDHSRAGECPPDCADCTA